VRNITRARIQPKETAVAKVTMVTGILLTILGVVFYVFWKPLGAPTPSKTALIPAFLGIPLIVLGWLSLAKPDLRMHLMHAAVTLALLGFLASAGRLISVLIKKPGLGAGVIANLLMALICGVYVALCVRSFIAARRARAGRET
jgi:hypothetical protein